MLLGVAFASSLSLYADADQARIQGTEARVFVWLTNTDGVAKTVAFSASDGELNGFFEDSGFILPASGSKGTWLHLRAPDCFRGAETVRVYADVCSSPTSCTTLQKTVLIIANPSGACNSYVGSFVSPYGVGQPMAYGDGSVVYSTLTYASDFQPTDYSVDVLGSDRCVPLKPGEQATVPLTVVNNGAASTFEVRVLSEGHDLSLLISPQSLSLSRGEAFDLRASIIPQSGHAPGRRYASVQVMRHGVVLFEKSVCVDVREQFEAEVKLPSSASGMQCEPIELDGVVKNTGNVGDSFEVTGPANAIVMPNGFMVDAGESRAFKIILPENSLRAGQSEVLVTAKSSARDIVGSARLLVNAQSCAPAVLPGDAVKPIQSQGDNGVKLTVGVTNGFDVPLTNVTARVEGIPPSWRVESSAVAVIAPQDTANLSISIFPSGSEDASNPVLVILSDGREIARRPLQPMKASGGLTGLFTGLSQNSLLIGMLLLAALAVIVLVARRQPSQSGFHERFKDSLNSIRHEIEAVKQAPGGKG